MYPSYNSKRYPAGCGVIAVSQILAHNKYPELILSINDFHINWNILDKFRYNDYTTTDSDKVHLATVIVNIGHMMNMKHISNNGLATQTRYKRRCIHNATFRLQTSFTPKYIRWNATHNMVHAINNYQSLSGVSPAARKTLGMRGLSMVGTNTQ